MLFTTGDVDVELLLNRSETSDALFTSIASVGWRANAASIVSYLCLCHWIALLGPRQECRVFRDVLTETIVVMLVSHPEVWLTRIRCFLLAAERPAQSFAFLCRGCVFVCVLYEIDLFAEVEVQTDLVCIIVVPRRCDQLRCVAKVLKLTQVSQVDVTICEQVKVNRSINMDSNSKLISKIHIVLLGREHIHNVDSRVFAQEHGPLV